MWYTPPSPAPPSPKASLRGLRYGGCQHPSSVRVVLMVVVSSSSPGSSEVQRCSAFAPPGHV